MNKKVYILLFAAALMIGINSCTTQKKYGCPSQVGDSNTEEVHQM